MIRDIGKSVGQGAFTSLWVLVPGLFVVLRTEDGELLSLAIELGVLLLSFPVLLTGTTLVINSGHHDASRVFACSIFMSVSGMLTAYLNFGLLLMIYSSGDGAVGGAGTDPAWAFSDFFDWQMLLIGLGIGLFCACLLFFRTTDPTSALSKQFHNAPVSEVGNSHPPKPTWDPRIEELRGQIASLHEAQTRDSVTLQQIQSSLWQFQRR